MTRDEERQAWRTYAAALAAGIAACERISFGYIARYATEVADDMLAEERERFDKESMDDS